MSSLKSAQTDISRTTIYLTDSVKNGLDKYISSRKKTAFINDAIEKALEQIKRNNVTDEINQMIAKIKPTKPIISSAKAIKEIRESSIKNIK